MKIHFINLLLLCNLGLTSLGDLSPANGGTSEVIFQFKTTELLRFSLHDCPASISAKSHVFPKGTVLLIAVDQATSTRIYYQMDSAPEQPYFESIRLVAKGEHVVTMWTIDSLNRESVLNSIKFNVVE